MPAGRRDRHPSVGVQGIRNRQPLPVVGGASTIDPPTSDVARPREFDNPGDGAANLPRRCSRGAPRRANRAGRGFADPSSGRGTTPLIRDHRASSPTVLTLTSAGLPRDMEPRRQAEPSPSLGASGRARRARPRGRGGARSHGFRTSTKVRASHVVAPHCVTPGPGRGLDGPARRRPSCHRLGRLCRERRAHDRAEPITVGERHADNEVTEVGPAVEASRPGMQPQEVEGVGLSPQGVPWLGTRSAGLCTAVHCPVSGRSTTITRGSPAVNGASWRTTLSTLG